MRGLPSILSLFRNELNKFNDTRARMLDSIYHMTNTFKSHFWRKNVLILSSCTQRCYGRHICKPLVVYRFYCTALFHSQTRRQKIKTINAPRHEKTNAGVDSERGGDRGSGPLWKITKV